MQPNSEGHMQDKGAEVEVVLLPRKRPFVVLGLLFSVPIVIVLVGVIHRLLIGAAIDSSPFKLIFWAVVVYLCIAIWIGLTKVVVTSDGVSYMSMENLLRTEFLKFDEIKKAEVFRHSAVWIKHGKMKPINRLELIPIKGLNKPDIYINIQVFTGEDVRRLYTILESKGVQLKGAGKYKPVT